MQHICWSSFSSELLFLLLQGDFRAFLKRKGALKPPSAVKFSLDIARSVKLLVLWICLQVFLVNITNAISWHGIWIIWCFHAVSSIWSLITFLVGNLRHILWMLWIIYCKCNFLHYSEIGYLTWNISSQVPGFPLFYAGQIFFLELSAVEKS